MKRRMRPWRTDGGRRAVQRRLDLEWLEPRRALAVAGAAVGPPGNLSCTTVSSSEIGLAWELRGDGDTAVIVERREGAAGAFATVAVLSGGETIFTDTGCWAGRSYTYRVKARGPGGDSSYSAESVATTSVVGGDAFAAVTGLSAMPRSPTEVEVSFVDVNAGAASHLVERSADGITYAVVAALGTATSWRDTGLEAGSPYWYRVRDTGWSRATSDYSVPVRIETPRRPAAAPLEPSAVDAVALSGTAVRLSWVATDPLPASYAIERSVDYDPWHPVTWTRVGVTADRATSFVDAGLRPETPYVYRVTAVRAGIESAPGRPASDVMRVLFGTGVGVVTASAGTGGPRSYDIGPGRPLTRLADLDWGRLGPGDTVNIHFKPGGYRELLQISSRGTPAAWITVNGVPDPATGEMPFIDGRGAVLAPQFRNHYGPVDGSGGIVVGTRPGFTHGYKPGFIAIRGIDVRNCHSSSSFTDAAGVSRAYGRVGAGIYLERCDHVTITGCAVHDNGEGIFGAGQSDFDRVMTDITLDSNRIWGNGNVGSDREHNTYIEAVDVVYQFNRYGPLRPGSLGAGLKDRSAGTVIRFNWIEGGAHQLQLPEAQNQADLAVTLPRYRRTVVEGNTLVAPPGAGASLIWFGGDQGLAAWYRKGVLTVAHNTLVVRSDKTQVWKQIAIEAASGGEALDVRNNILAAIPATPGGDRPDFGLVGGDNRVSFGRNWVTPGWVLTTADDFTFTGSASGTSNLVGGPANDPGFVDVVAGDYRLRAGSVCIDAAGRLPEGLADLPVTREFRLPAGGVPRPVNGRAADLGSFEAAAVAPPSPVPTPLVAPANLAVVAQTANRVRLTWTDRSRNETGFVVERWQDGRGWIRVATTAANATSFTDGTTAAGIRYAYRVRAAVGTGAGGRLSAATAVVWVRTPAAVRRA